MPPASAEGGALTDLVSIASLQKLQDRFTELGQVTVCICTVAGEPITTPTWGSGYSRLIGTSRRGRREFAEAIRTCVLDEWRKAPAHCHEGMTLHATAIAPETRRLAVIVAGTRSPVPPPAEQVRAIAKQYQVDPEELVAAAHLVDPYNGGAPEAIHRFADVLADTIATLYSQACRIERQLADMNMVHHLAGLLSGSRDLQEILDMTVKRVVEVVNVKACAIRLLNEETGELTIKAVHNLSDDYLHKGPVTVQNSPIDAATLAGQTVHIADAATDPRIRYPANARREGIVSGLCVPMTYRARTVGVLRVYTAHPYSFSESEEALLRSIGSQAASAIINTELYRQHLAAERFQRQVDAAAEIQRRMLPAHPPTRRFLSLGCVYVPTLQVGGDFYDFIELADGGLGICIADVVGKGLPAALLMASVRSAMRAAAEDAKLPKLVVSAVNRHMCRDTLVGEFATLFYGTFSADGRHLTYSNAGHPPPVILRGGDFIELQAGGMVIGFVPGTEYEQEAVELCRGDVLVMMTDGVTDAMNFDGSTYDRDRLLSSIRQHRALDAGQLAKQILWDVRRFVGLAHQSDDITVVVAKIL